MNDAKDRVIRYWQDKNPMVKLLMDRLELEVLSDKCHWRTLELLDGKEVVVTDDKERSVLVVISPKKEVLICKERPWWEGRSLAKIYQAHCDDWNFQPLKKNDG